MTPAERQAALSELARVKVLFQLRAVRLVLGAPASPSSETPKLGCGM
jgi:hypothetical protein